MSRLAMSIPRRKVAIIGSGPAGHTAAIYAARAMLEPIMYEGFMAGGVAAGGQLTTTTEVENFPGFPEGITGPAFTAKLREQSERFGTKILTETVEKVDLSVRPFKIYRTAYMTEAESEYEEADTLIIATGATAKRLGVKGEEEYWQRGISACAVCDGTAPIFRDNPLIVIGGGDSACEEAVFLTKYASKVYLVVRRSEMRASEIMQERAINHPKIEVKWNSQVVEIKGTDGKVSSAILDINGGKEQEELKVSGVFYAIGHTPNTGFLNGQLPTDESGYLLVTPGTTKTSIPGVFAAGDVQDKTYRQAITAAGTGCMAALEAEKFLHEA